MTITFNYKQVDRPEPYPSQCVPAIPVTLIGAKVNIAVVGLLDSGADYCAIPKGMADILGLDLSSKPEPIGGIGGDAKAIKTKMRIMVWKGREKYTFTVGVYVVVGQMQDDFPLLIGRDGFFDKFKITFIEKQRKIKLKRDLS